MSPLAIYAPGIILGVFTISFVGFWLWNSRRRSKRPAFRPLEALQSLHTTVGQAVESGRRLHISLGSGSIGSTDSATALSGLIALDHVATAAVISDKPPVVTSGDGIAMLLAQDTLKGVYVRQNALERYDATSSRIAGLTPISYATALTTVIPNESVAGTILIGSVGPEVVLLTEASNRRRVTVLGGSDEPTAQAALFAAADYPLIGEDLFAASAYLGHKPAHYASLQTQDVMRILIGGAMVGLAALATLMQFFSL